VKILPLAFALALPVLVLGAQPSGRGDSDEPLNPYLHFCGRLRHPQPPVQHKCFLVVQEILHDRNNELPTKRTLPNWDREVRGGMGSDYEAARRIAQEKVN
jgi:hypothetical protein